MSNDTEYNGWTNYETWNCALWMDNDQGSQEYWQEAAQECYDGAEKDDIFTRKENARLALADRIKEHHEEAAEAWMPDQASFFADILNAGLSSVDWHEIAEHYMNEVEEEADESAVG